MLKNGQRVICGVYTGEERKKLDQEGNFLFLFFFYHANATGLGCIIFSFPFSLNGPPFK